MRTKGGGSWSKELRWGVGVLVGVSLGLGGAGCGGRTLTTSVQDQVLVPGTPAPSAKAEEAALPPPPTPTEAAKPEPGPSSPEPLAGRAPEEESRATEPPVPPPAPAPVPEEPPPPVAAGPAPLEAGAPVPEPGPPPAAAVPAPAAPALADVFFDFDQFALRHEARRALEVNAQMLKSQAGWRLLIEGHCDERGTADYNLVLGERRAQAVKRYLAELGVPAGPMQTTSYGKERPFCREHSEGCWQTNRRAHLRQQ